MSKQILSQRPLFYDTRRLLSGRVFFALGRQLVVTPVIFYTRARVGWDKGRQQLLAGLLLGGILLGVLGLNMAAPLRTIAATSDNINFQARLENSNGAIANDGNYNVQFKLYSTSTGGSALWTETYLNSASQGVRVVNGYLTVNLGSITAFPSTISWDQDMYITMNIGGTTAGIPSYDGEMNPRLKLTAVPYAFQAKSASQLQVSSGANIATLSFTTPTATNNILLPDASGTVCLNSSAACGFAFASGSSNYIQNGTSLQGNANFNIQTGATGSITVVIQALTGQTADLLRFKNAAGTAALGGFNSGGQLYYQSGSFTGTLVQDSLAQSTTYHLPDPGGASVTICLTTGNCAGTGGGITGTGTTNYVARFNSASTINASSLLYDNGSFIGINTTGNNGQLSVLSTNASQAGTFIQAAANATTATLVVKGGATPGSGGTLVDLQDSTGVVLATITADGSILTGSNAVVGSTTTPSGTIGGLTVVAAGGASVGGVLRGGASQTGDLLELQDSTGLINAAFNAAGNQLTLGRIAGSGTVTQGKLRLGDGTTDNFALTLQSATLTANSSITLPNAAGNDTVCLLGLANCTGTGGGIAGAGTQNYISKFNTLGGNHVGNSSLYDDGSFVGLNTTTDEGLLSIQGAGATQTGLFVQAAASATQPVVIFKGGVTPGSGGNLLELQTSTGSVVARFDAAGNFLTAGSATVNNGLSVLGGASIIGGTSINTTGTANTSIGNSGGALSLTSTGLNLTTAGAISGITTLSASSTITLGNLGVGLVQSSSGGVLSSSAVDRNSSTFFNTALSVANGGTGLASTTAYGLLTGGTTSTGALQSVSTGSAGQVLVSGGASALPSFQTATAANTCSDCLIQNPLTTGRNTVAPTTNSVVGLTVNGTSGTAAPAVNIVQGGNAANITLSNTGSTSGSLISLTQSTSTFSGDGILLNLANGSGTFSGNFVDLQKNSVSQFKVDTNGNVTAAGTLSVNGTGKTAVTIADSGAQNSGITIGGDTNLYRSAADTLKTDDTLIVAPASNPANGMLISYTTNTSTVNARGLNLTPTFTGSAGGVGGAAIQPIFQPSADISIAYGFINAPQARPGAGVTITELHGGYHRIDTGNTAGAVTQADALTLAAPTLGTLKPAAINGVNVRNQGSAGVGTAIGIEVTGQSGATTNIGLRLAKSDTYTLQLADTTGVAAGGITFGTDTTLYRSTANELTTDDSLVVGTNLNVSGNTDLNGTLTVGNANQFTINVTGAITAATGITSSGSIQFSGLNSVGIVQTNGSGTLSTSAVDRNSAMLLSNALNVSNGGTGLAATTAYGLITGGTTATGNFQNAGTGSAGQILQSNGAAALPTWVGTTAANTCSDCLIQNPLTTARNTITPTTNSVIGLTVNGTSGTAAPAVTIVQGGNAANLTLSNTAATTGNLVSLTQNTSVYSGTAMLLNIAAGSGSFSTGNFIDLQKNSASQFKVDNSGAVTEAGKLTIQAGGLDVTGGYTQSGTAANSFGGVTSLSNTLTLNSGTNGNQFKITSAPTASATNSLVQLGNAITGGDVSVNGGTYLGINQPSSGAGSAADFVNFQSNGTVKLQVSNAGLLNAAGGFATGANTGITSNCSGGQVLSGAVYNGGIVTGGTCSSPAGFVTLQDAYNNSASANPQIVLNHTYGGIKIADEVATPVTGNLFQVTSSNGSTVYLGASATGVTAAGTLTVSGTNTSSIAGRLNLTLSSGIGLAVTSNATVAGSLSVGSTSQFQVDASGNVSTSGQVTAGPDASHQFKVSNNGTITETYGNSSNSTAATFAVTNTLAGAGTATVNALGINLTGTSNGTGINITNAINFGNIAGTPMTGNTFNGLAFGTGYNSLLTYNGTPLIGGTGKLQDAAVDSTVTYANLQKVGALTAGSIASGFGTISTANNVTTTAALQGNTLAVGNASTFDKFTVDTSGNTLLNGGTFTVGTSSQFQISALGVTTLAGANGNLLAVTSAPTATASLSMVRLGNAISGGNVVANGGTYLGINQPSSGAGSAADFVNFQSNGTTQFKVTSNGNTTVNGTLSVQNAGSAVPALSVSGIISASSLGTTGTSVLCYNASSQISSCGSAAGSGSYIYNSTSLQTTANFNIQAVNSGIAGTVGATIQAAAGGQTADLLQFKNTAGAILTAFQADGKLAFGPSGSQDTNLYRSTTDTLKTDDSLHVAASTLTAGYMRVGSLSAPVNTTAGDFTSTRLSVGNTTFSAGSVLDISGTNTNTAAGAIPFSHFAQTIAPTSNSSSEFRSLYFQNFPDANAGITLGTLTAGYFEGARIGPNQNGNIATVNGLNVYGIITDTSSNAASNATTVKGAAFTGISRFSGTSTTTVTDVMGVDIQPVGNGATTATNAYGLRLQDSGTGNTITNQIGIDIQTQTRGITTNAGLRIAAPSGATNNYALQLSSTAGTAAGGITFGTDTNLYRTAAGNELKTDDAFTAVGLITGTAGVTISGGAINLNTAGANAINIGTSTNTGAIAIGNAGNAANTVSIEAGSTSGAIVIGNGGTAHNIQIGTGAAAQTVTLGSTDTTSTTTVQGGSNGIVLNTGGTVRATFNNSNNVYFGNGVTAAAPNAFAINGTGSSTAGTTGAILTVAGGTGTSTGTGSAGGGLTLQGGTAGAGSTARAGGAVTIQGGTAAGTGTAVGGTVAIQGGTSVGTTAGSSVTLTGGTAIGTNQNGGIVSLQGGTPTGTGTYGSINLQASGGNVGIGTATPSRTLHVATSSTATTVPQLLVEQNGSGDAGIEFKSAAKSFYAGVDASDLSKFKISSSTASGASSTFGNTATAGATDSGNNGQYICSGFTATGTGTLNSITVNYKNIDGTNNQAQAAIYSNSGNAPSARMATSSSLTLTTPGQYTFPLTASVVNGTLYWLCASTNTASNSLNNLVLDAGGTNQEQSSNIGFAFGSWPASWPGTSFSANFQFEMFANVSATATDNFNTALFTLTDTGQANFQNSVNSTTAFQIQNASGGSKFSVDTTNGRIGIGTATPARELHIADGIARIDKSSNSAGIMLHRYSGATPWKTFFFGADATGSNAGEFFISDFGTAVSGASTRRLTVDTDGTVLLSATQTNIATAGLTFYVDGDTIFRSLAGNSTTAFQVQNTSSQNLISVNTATPGITFHGGVTGGTLITDIAGTGTNSALCHNGGATATENVQIVDCTTAPAADYAENYSVATGIVYGDIVATGTQLVNTYDTGADGNVDWTKLKGQVTQLVKSNVPYQTNTIGIVSDNHGDFTAAGHNIKQEDNPMPVALNGRVPVNISPSSEAIQPGDYLTTSADTGKAMKATGPGFVIGKALESWDPVSGKTNVMVYIEQGYWQGPSMSSYIQNGSSATINNLIVGGDTHLANLNVSGPTTLTDLSVQTVTVSGDLTVVGSATVGTLKVLNNAEFAGDLNLAGVGQSRNAITKKFKASKDLHIGDVVIADPDKDGQVTTTTAAGDTKVLGIALTDTLEGENVTVAIGGSVQVKAAATTLANGDLLVSAVQEGKADKSATPITGSILGKALGKTDTNGLVWILVTLQ